MSSFLRRILLVPLLLGMGACAAPRPAGPPPTIVDLRPVWEARLLGETDRALAVADDLGWERTGSVAAERQRQELHLLHGERGRLRAEIARWRAADPDDPDLAYLDARLLQDPQRLEDRLAWAARRWPTNTWIQLGLAARGLARGLPTRAIQAHLRAAPPRAGAAPFRRRLEARLLARGGSWKAALARIEGDAFVSSDLESLLLYADLARRGGLRAAEERARSELALQSLHPDRPLVERVDTAARRAFAELATGRIHGLRAFLSELDHCCERAHLETGWRTLPRYRLGGFGSLVRPEREVGGPVAQWAEAGRALLVGDALFHGLEVLYLKDVVRVSVPWPGSSQPLEILVAGSARSSRVNRASGGTIFRGFYIRRDLVRTTAQYLEQATAEVPERVDLPELPPDATLSNGIPEDLDLPLRLRARLLRSGIPAKELETEALLLHESGHLPDLLPWLPDGPGLLAALPAVLASLLRHGDGMAWLEERAETRALAVSPHPGWLLAEVVDYSRSGHGRYAAAYRRLLHGLTTLARASGLPPLARWDGLGDERIRTLAASYLKRRGWKPLPPHAVHELADRVRAALTTPDPPPRTNDKNVAAPPTQ